MNEFKSLPEQVRSWLSSSVATTIISRINKRLGITDRDKMRIIPSSVLRIVLSDLLPDNLYGELLIQLNLNDVVATSLTKEIEETIFRPIELTLRNQVGIDTKAILSGIGRQLPSSSPQPIQTPVAIRVEPTGHPEAQPKDLEILRSTQNDSRNPAPASVNPPIRQIPTPPPFPQNRPTFQPIRPPIVRLPINTPKGEDQL